MRDPLTQWLDAQPAGLEMESDGCWSLVGGGWGGGDVHRIWNDAVELGGRVADALDCEWYEDELPCRYDYLVQTGGILYDPDTGVLYEDGGPAIIFI